jgi:hypothetical protein
MNFYLVDQFHGNIATGGKTDFFHTLLFHGRQQEKSYRLVDPFLGDEYIPLRLNRIGTFVPPVISPTVNWVVSETVRNALDGFLFGFERVQFRKLIDYPYFPPGDVSYEHTPEYQEAQRKDLLKFFEYLPNVPAFHKAVEPRYELLVHRLDDVKGSYRKLEKVTLVMERCMPFEVTLRISAALLRDHPIVWDYHHIVSEQAFAVLEPLLDRDYFEVVEAEI